MRGARLAALVAALGGAGCTGTGTGAGNSAPLLVPATDRYETCSVPAFVEAMQRAQALVGERQNSAALEWLQRAVVAGPDHVPTHLLYIDTAEAVGGAAAASSRAFYVQADDRPGSPVLPFCRARLAEDDHTRLTLLDEALKRDPSFYFGHLAHARVHRGLGRLDVAQQSLAKALAARPRHLESNLEMALVLAELGKYVQAEPYFATYVAARPEDRLVAKTYAQVLLYRLNKPREAGVVLRRLTQDAPKDADIAMDLAALAWREGRTDAAIQGYHQVLQLDRGATRAALNLGNLYFEVGQKQDGAARAQSWGRARKAYQFFLKAPRTAGLHDHLDEMFTVPYRLDLIGGAVADDGAAPTPGANF